MSFSRISVFKHFLLLSLQPQLGLEHLDQKLVQDDLALVPDLFPEPSQHGIGLTNGGKKQEQILDVDSRVARSGKIGFVLVRILEII